ncbi:MAG: hypothetical protein Q4G52_07155 [Clostridia bacterium]|nr:hypothetical protein [Clostridia bacterium]
MFSSSLFHSRLSAVCRSHATTITTFARDVLGLSTSVPTNWKNGTVPGADAVYNSCAHFGVTADYLLGLSSSPVRAEAAELTQEELDCLALLRGADPDARQIALAAMRAVLEASAQKSARKPGAL